MTIYLRIKKIDDVKFRTEAKRYEKAIFTKKS